jgi:hypothetical protein
VLGLFSLNAEGHISDGGSMFQKSIWFVSLFVALVAPGALLMANESVPANDLVIACKAGKTLFNWLAGPSVIELYTDNGGAFRRGVHSGPFLVKVYKKSGSEPEVFGDLKQHLFNWRGAPTYGGFAYTRYSTSDGKFNFDVRPTSNGGQTDGYYNGKQFTCEWR